MRNCLRALQARCEWRECWCECVCAKYWSIFAKLSSALRNASPGPAQAAAAQSCDHHLQTSPHLPGPGLLAAGWRLWWCRIQTFTRCTGRCHHAATTLPPLTRGHGLEVTPTTTGSPPPGHHQPGADSGGDNGNGGDDEGTV